MRTKSIVALSALTLASFSSASPAADRDVGQFVRALWLVQRHGTPEANDPRNDRKTKGMLTKALGKTTILTVAGASGLFEPTTFVNLAGSDERLEPLEVDQLLAAHVPASRKSLFPKVASHADLLTTSFDMIDEAHRAAGETLVDWIVRKYSPGQPLHVTAVCTGNSRRSILVATIGNIAAAYYGLPEIRFHSGGTAPTAFNARTVATLGEVGVKIHPTGAEAPRGEPQTANPIFKVRWGNSNAFESSEFSKVYFDPSNPQAGFAALMVCSEADAACPFVKGADLRVSMPYLDPKIYDGGSFEKAKYAERRDDIGRLMLCVMMQVRNRLGPR